MAKVQQKSEKITAFGGIFFVLDKFDSILSSVIDSHLGLRSTLIGYLYSEIIRAVFSVFCCGGDCMEDLNLYLKDILTERPQTRRHLQRVVHPRRSQARPPPTAKGIYIQNGRKVVIK